MRARRIDRRAALATIGLSSLAFAAPAAAGAQSEPSEVVRLGVVPVEICAQAFYALDLGIFRQAGLDVRLESFSNPGAIATALIGGSIDVGLFDSAGLITAHTHNVPLMFLAAGKLFDVNDPPFGIVAGANSPIRSAKDFAGTFAVSSVSNIAVLAMLAWIDVNGGDSKRVKFVELPFPSMIPAIERGTVDGVLVVEPFISAAIEKGLRPFWPLDGIASSYAASGSAATRAWTAAHPAVAARLKRALYEGGRWGNHNREASIPILVKYTKLPAAIVAKMHRGVFAESTNTALLQPVITAAVKYEFIAKPFPAADLF